MNPDLEKALMTSLQSQSVQSQPSALTYQDHLSALMDEMQKRDINAKLEASFNQVLNKTNQTLEESPQFEQISSVKSLVSGDMMKKYFGASISGTVAGIVSGFIPINLGLQGVPSLAGAFLVNKLAKGKTAGSIAEGIAIAGGSQLISGLLGGNINSLLGNLGGNASPRSANTGNVVF